MTNEIGAVNSSTQVTSMQSYCFASADAFKAAYDMAVSLSKATLVPTTYQNNIPNCIIALEVAQRMSASPLMVMQNLYIVHNKPSWSSQFIISAINTCGRFKPIRFDLTGIEGADDRSCVAWTVERGVQIPENIRTLADAKKANVPILESPKVSINIAKKEGWYDKSGSKWKTMPELMLHYRAASFFGRLYAPEILMGMHTQEEVEDMVDVTPARLKEAFMEKDVPTSVPNKLEEILMPKPPKFKEPEQVDALDTSINEIMNSRADEIIISMHGAQDVKELSAIWKNNNTHISAMSEDLRNMISATKDEIKNNLEKI